MRNKIVAASLAVVAGFSLTACSSTRQIDPAQTNSFQIPGTSWYGFCQGRNAFIWIPSRTDGDPDELEAVVYDDYRCVKGLEPTDVTPSSKPDTDPDGIVDDED